MKLRILFFMGLVLAYAGIAQAANTLKVRNVELAPGGSVTLNVELDNETTNLMGWQCDIVLPEGLSLELKSNGKPAATLGGRFSTTGHSISSSRLANGAYRFIATSMDGEAIPGTTGTLFSVTLKADASVTAGATLTGTVTNIEFNTQDNKKKTLGDISFSVAIPGGGTIIQPNDQLTVNDLDLAPSGSVTLNVGLDNETTNLMGWQCDIVLPEGLSLELKTNGKPAATLGGRFSTTGHSISSSRLANGAYRFIATSMDGEAIPETTGTLFSVTLKADASVTAGSTLTGTVTNIEFNTQDNKKMPLEDITFTVAISNYELVCIVADDQTRAYGEDNPAWTYTVTSGEVYGNGSPAMNCEATPKSPVGKYDITIEKGTVENPATLTKGTLTVTKAPLTITAKSYSIKQGEPLPTTYEITYSGFKNGETKSVLSQQPTVTCSATASSEPGRYDIIVSGATAYNYAISYVKGTLRIRSLVAEPGDLNDDGEVDVTDVVELIDMVLAGIYDPAGDINGDGEVDVTDVVELIDMVLSGE